MLLKKEIIDDNKKLREKIERLNNKNEELLSLYTTEREVKDYYKNIINELEKVLDENVELTYVHYGRKQCNKTLTEGGLLFRDYIKNKLQELKGSDKK